MSVWAVLGFLLFGSAFFALGWISVQSLRQAAILRSCRWASLAGKKDQAIAIRGAVRVDEPVHIAHLGDCLWWREIVKARNRFWSRRKYWSTESDRQTTADFSIMIGEEPIAIAPNPTEVHGHRTERDFERADVVDSFLGEPDESVTEEWLPIVAELTVAGRLMRVGDGWMIDRDPKVGLLFSIDLPEVAARWESIKGMLGLAGAITALVTMVYFWISVRGLGP